MLRLKVCAKSPPLHKAPNRCTQHQKASMNLKNIITVLLSLFITTNILAQQKKSPQNATIERSREIPDSVFWATIYLLDSWEEIATMKTGIRWFVSKKIDSKIGDVVRVPIMVYLPEYKASNNKIYSNVILDEVVEFDCKAKKYRIRKIVYNSGFRKVFDTVLSQDPIYKDIQNGTVWEAALNYSCKLK